MPTLGHDVDAVCLDAGSYISDILPAGSVYEVVGFDRDAITGIPEITLWVEGLIYVTDDMEAL